MTRTPGKTVLYILLFALVLSAGSFAFAAGDIYVNSSSEVLGVDISSAYAVGGGGVSPVSDTYVLTGSGVEKLGNASQGSVTVPGGEDDGTTIALKTQTAKIGLYYYYNASRNTSLTEARLENKVGSGYRFGFFDSSRMFHELASTEFTQLTMRPEGSGNGVNVYETNSGTLLYSHTDPNTRLGIMPISGSAKAVTWFKQVTYMGGFEYFRYNGGNLTVINVIDVEDYIKGVVPVEMTASWPAEALKAQALCAKSYYATNVNAYSKYGFDITCDTYCQAYKGTLRATAASDAAVDAVAGEYLTYNGSYCNTLYSSSSGGGTEDSENVFSSAIGYLRGVIDPFSTEVPASMNSYHEWTREYTGAELASKAGNGMGTVVSVTPTYSDTGNVIALKVSDASGKSFTFTKDQCRTGVSVPSIHYTVEPSATNAGAFTFTGGGWGHNVGMSQFGAYAMAQYHGYNYRQILRFYFTGVSISKGV